MKGTDMNANTNFQRKLMWFWDLIDISENIRRAERESAKVANDFVSAGMHFIAFALLTIVAGAFAWHFDFESTLVGMSTLRETIIPNLPGSVNQFSTLIGISFTIAPTLLEIFSAAYAKAEVKILQIFVIGFTFFDMVTDIPRAATFTNSLQPHFDQLGVGTSFIAHWVFFIFWLFLSTIGFELGMVIFGFLTIIFFFKTLNLRHETAMPPVMRQNMPKVKNPAQNNSNGGGSIIIESIEK